MAILLAYLACFFAVGCVIGWVLGQYRRPPILVIVKLALRDSPIRLVVAAFAAGMVAQSFAFQEVFGAAKDVLLAVLLVPIGFVGLLTVGIWALLELESQMGRSGALLFLRWLHRGGPESFDLKREALLLKRDRARVEAETKASSDQEAP